MKGLTDSISSRIFVVHCTIAISGLSLEHHGMLLLLIIEHSGPPQKTKKKTNATILRSGLGDLVCNRRNLLLCMTLSGSERQ